MSYAAANDVLALIGLTCHDAVRTFLRASGQHSPLPFADLSFDDQDKVLDDVILILDGATPVEANRSLLFYAIVHALAPSSAPIAQHLVELNEDYKSYHLQHPFSCRPNLFDCAVDSAVNKHVAAGKVDTDGFFRVVLDAQNVLQFSLLGATIQSIRKRDKVSFKVGDMVRPIKNKSGLLRITKAFSDGSYLAQGLIFAEEELELVKLEVAEGDTVRVVLEGPVQTMYPSTGHFLIGSDVGVGNSISPTAEHVKSIEITKKVRVFKQGDIIKGGDPISKDIFLYDPANSKKMPFVYLGSGDRIGLRRSDFNENFYGTPRVIGNLTEITSRT